jgi:hypothetical protein
VLRLSRRFAPKRQWRRSRLQSAQFEEDGARGVIAHDLRPRRLVGNPLYADDRNFYKVELWTMDEQRVLRMLYAYPDVVGEDRARLVEVIAGLLQAGSVLIRLPNCKGSGTLMLKFTA